MRFQLESRKESLEYILKIDILISRFIFKKCDALPLKICKESLSLRIRMVKNFVFDLDDTLFREIDWVKSALRHTSELVSEIYPLDSEMVFETFWKGLQTRGRGKVFRKSLEEVGVEDAEDLFPYLFYRYRVHEPDDIKLMPGVESTLKKLRDKGCKLGIITDGVITAQQNKVKGLGLEKMVDAIIYTEVFGYEFRKPSSVPFSVMKHWLGNKGEFYYIGDNPDKDFIGARETGFKTVMLRDDGNSKKVGNLDKNQLADMEISCIEEVLEIASQL